ncbi:hypothetical protein N7448_009514 [Penicillium atrosanguineum]|nr:hypothetical protein N7448_009514 [Penicillium atrosanguineum]
MGRNDTGHISSELFNSLEELSRIVDISYCVSTTGIQEPFQCLSHCAEFPNLELVTTWSTGILLSDSCGYIAVSHSPGPKRIIAAFRGTYSIANTIIDLSAVPQSYVPYFGDGDQREERLTANPGPSTPRCENCTVHAGFLKSWINTRSVVLPHLLEARDKHPDYEVTLVGHSLGGAVAALAGLEMRLKGWNPEVTTFGEPMVGNADFAGFLDSQFELGNYTKPTANPEARRFRRVTHIDDPVPLLPLREWGYAPHSGEVYISNPDLSPTIEDVHLCVGNEDPQCIAGSDTPSTLSNMLQDANIPLNIFNSHPDPCPESEDVLVIHPGEQDVLAKQKPANCVSRDETRALYARRWSWSLIPARYRLWELFYAHRDYFWRIGLCVPGGDPTG